jgi:hypothetical protein
VKQIEGVEAVVNNMKFFLHRRRTMQFVGPNIGLFTLNLALNATDASGAAYLA